MAIYEYSQHAIHEVQPTTFAAQGVNERADLQRLLRDNIQVVSPGTFVIAEEFGDWEESHRRIDLLGLDKDANLVVVELKRTEDGGHMELQAIRYAAMVSPLTFDKAVGVHQSYLAKLGRDLDAQEDILRFLEWDEPDEESFGREVRIVLVSAEFSKELTTTVMWLNNRKLDIRCVRLRPHLFQGRLLIDAQQVIPLPEAAEYQIRLQEKEQLKDQARWDEASLLKVLRTTKGDNAADAARKLYRWIKPRVDRISWGSGRQFGALTAILVKGSTKFQILRITSAGKAVILLDKLRGKGPFADEAVLQQLRDRINLVPQADFKPEAWRFRYDLDALVDASCTLAFQQVCEWILERINESY